MIGKTEGFYGSTGKGAERAARHADFKSQIGKAAFLPICRTTEGMTA